MEPAPDSEKWERLVLDVAAGNLDRDQTTQRQRKLLKRLGKQREKE
jgi:hypothetical protein